MDHLGYGLDVFNNDTDDGYNGWGFGPDDVADVCGSCHSTFNGDHSGSGTSSNSGGFSSDIGGESGYGGIGL